MAVLRYLPIATGWAFCWKKIVAVGCNCPSDTQLLWSWLMLFTSFGNWCKNLLNKIRDFISAGLFQFSESLECWDLQNFLLQAPGGVFLHSGKGHPKSHALSSDVVSNSQYPVVLQSTAMQSRRKGGLQPWKSYVLNCDGQGCCFRDGQRTAEDWSSDQAACIEGTVKQSCWHGVWVWTRNHWGQCKIT